MATARKNLSELDRKDAPSATLFKFGIIVSEWNSDITNALLEGACETLGALGASSRHIHTHHVPGSFELPVGAKLMIESGAYDAVIAIGSVIQGETRHFDFVCHTVAAGIKDVSLSTGVPIIFCVLTDNTIDQAKARSGGKYGNKGVEAAVAAVKMAHLRRKLIDMRDP